MNLAHPPGHIFWKTEPQVDRLSVYVERVVEEEEEETEPRHSDTAPSPPVNIQALVEKLYTRLFANDLMFARVFELPPKQLQADNGLHFSQVTPKQYECRLFFRRFIDPNCCQVVYGAQHDIPPGMAVYQLNPSLTNEQKAFVKDEWGPCMDEEGFMSPAKIYPWFAMGIVNTVQALLDEEREGNQEADELFEDMVVAGEYPVVKIVIPPKRDGAQMSRYNSNTNISSLLHSRSSLSDSVKTEDKTSQPEASQGQNRKEPKEKKFSPAAKTIPQWYPRGKPVQDEQRSSARKKTPTLTPRSSIMSDTPSSKTFSSFSREAETVQEEIKDEPFVITLKPAIKGYGLPSGIKLQHALPKQKPFCDIGKACIESLRDKLEDGQSLWYLEASTLTLTPNVEKSARFKSMMRKIGRESKFWNISFTPITSKIQQNMMDTMKCSEFPVDLEKVKQCINIMKLYHGWHCISDSLVDTALMNVAKSNMLTVRSLGEFTLKMLQFLQNVVENQSCPGFLQPNVNMVQGMNEKEGKWVAAEIKQVIKEIQKDPGYVLLYIGYQKRND